MKNKNGDNLMFFVFIVILFSTISCSKMRKYGFDGKLPGTDLHFSEISAGEGMHRTLTECRADSMIMLRAKYLPPGGEGCHGWFLPGSAIGQ